MSEVIFYTSDEVGAPALTSTAGSLISLLDACLLNGFNAKSVVSAATAGGVCTLSVSVHNFSNGRKVLVAGLTTSALNGVKKITVIDANTISYAAVGVADGAQAGTATVKRAPLGWTKLFGDTQTGMYQRGDVSVSAYCLRVDDSTTNAADGYSRASVVLAPTDFNTYTERFPLASQNQDAQPQVFWTRGFTTSPDHWTLVGDGTTFYLFAKGNSSDSLGFQAPRGFGDLISLVAGDTHGAFIGGDTVRNTPNFLSGRPQPNGPIDLVNGGAAYVARDYSGFVASTFISNMGRVAFPMGSPNCPMFPNPANNGLSIETRSLVLEHNASVNAVPRGYYPGVAEPAAYLPGGYQGHIFTVAGKDYLTVIFQSQSVNNSGAALFDITGPWQ